MTRQHFSTKALLKIALEVESSHENNIKSNYFDLDKLNLIILRNDYIIDERAAKVLWFRFERDMTIDEIVNEMHFPAHIIRTSLKDSITRIHCFSLVYRSPSTRDIDCNHTSVPHVTLLETVESSIYRSHELMLLSLH